jgi:hypothetical protein
MFSTRPPPLGSTTPKGRGGLLVPKPTDGPYTEGKEGIMADVGGLGFVAESLGESARSGVSEIEVVVPEVFLFLWVLALAFRVREREVRSRDCARVVKERGLVLCDSFSRILDSRSESLPRLYGSSITRPGGGRPCWRPPPRVAVGVGFQ